jgi:hypothetical protein
MKRNVKRRIADGWGGPGAHLRLVDVIDRIAAVEDEAERADALRKAGRAVPALLYFCYSPHELSLPTGPMSVVPIPTSAFQDADATLGDEDILAREAPKLTIHFATGAHPTLSDERRASLWVDILERLHEREREILECVRRHRRMPQPALSREFVELALPGFLDQPMPTAAPVEPITYAPSGFYGDPAPIVEPQAPAQPRVRSERERHYDQLMRQLGFA